MIHHLSFIKKIGQTGLIISILFPLGALAYEAAPIVITKAPTYTTEKSVRLNGRVNPSEMPDTKQWFEWGIVGQYQTVYETPHNGMWGQNSLANTSADLIGLAPSTQYFYRQVAENGNGKDVGQTIYFTTKVLPLNIVPIVIVQTNDATEVRESMATLRGYVSPQGDGRASFWFQWGTSMNLENETPHQGHGGDSGYIETSLSGLTPGTSYFFRTVGENDQGRTYGSTRVFVTLGTPPPPSETPKEQYVPTPQKSTDSGARTITTNGTSGGASNAPIASGRPGDFFNFGSLFGGQKNTAVTPSVGSQTGQQSANTSASQEVAGAGAASGQFGFFWNALMGKKVVELDLEKIGPKNVSVHTPVEYRITYHYHSSIPAKDAKLKITLPEDVVYIGDTTNNELLLEESSGPERTYVLPLGRLEEGSTRSISILGMTTGSETGFPDARARMEYVDQSGTTQVVAATGGVVGAPVKNTANVSASGGAGFLPNSLLSWLLYIVVIIGSIFGIRKAKEYYARRKSEIEAKRSPGDDHPVFSGGGRTAQGV